MISADGLDEVTKRISLAGIRGCRAFSPRSLVQRLLFPSCPAAIARLVIPVVVDALDAVGRCRSLAQVSEKMFKLAPAVADLDSAAAVVGVSRGAGIGAARHHPLPNPINRCVRVSMLCGTGADVVMTQAPAALRQAISESGSDDDSYFTAVASTTPTNEMGVFGALREDKPSAKTKALQVNLRGHREAPTFSVSRDGLLVAAPSLYFTRLVSSWE